MSAIRKATTLLCVAGALVVCNVATSAADTAAELAAIHAVDQAWEKAFNTGDAAAVAGLYAEDAVLLPPGSPSVKGRTAIRAYFEKEIAATAKEGLKFSLDAKPSGGVSGDMGWASGRYAVKDKSGHVVDTGKYLSVSTKRDGKWLYVRDTWNSDAAAPAEPAAPAKK